MRLITIELINSMGCQLDFRTLPVEDGEQDLEGKLAAAVIAFCRELVLNTGDSIRISEYN